MSGNRRNRGLELGVLLLFSELYSAGAGTIPPVTLFTIIGQALLYMGVINVPWDKWDVCLSGSAIVRNKEYKRLILSAFEHGDDMHLYYNMVSFLVKGRSLERRYGSKNFCLLLAVITVLTSAMYVVISVCGAHILDDPYIMKTCAVGFSGVIFALKVITTKENPPGISYIMGMTVPSRYAAWVELIAIHLLVPNASFTGHLAGILAGLIYTNTFIGTIIDHLIRSMTGDPMIHDYCYTRRRSGGGTHNSYGFERYGTYNGDYDRDYEWRNRYHNSYGFEHFGTPDDGNFEYYQTFYGNGFQQFGTFGGSGFEFGTLGGNGFEFGTLDGSGFEYGTYSDYSDYGY